MARTLVHQDSISVGTIYSWIGGYFTNASNAGYTSVLGTGATDVLKANDYLTAKGWKVCDGTAPNDSESPIFNSASRYLPNMTDSRFFQGSTSIGASGGTNTLIDHTHSHGLSMAHTHTWSATSDGGTAHYHEEVYYANTSTVLATNSTPNWAGIYSSAGHYYNYAMTGVAATYATRGLSSQESSHTHAVSDSTDAASTNNVSGTVGTGAVPGSTDNRPKYINSLYIIKIK